MYVGQSFPLKQDINLLNPTLQFKCYCDDTSEQNFLFVKKLKMDTHLFGKELFALFCAPAPLSLPAPAII